MHVLFVCLFVCFSGNVFCVVSVTYEDEHARGIQASIKCGRGCQNSRNACSNVMCYYYVSFGQSQSDTFL